MWWVNSLKQFPSKQIRAFQASFASIHTMCHAFIINPKHLNISMDILHSVLHTFPYCADKENLLKNQELLQFTSSPLLL